LVLFIKLRYVLLEERFASIAGLVGRAVLPEFYSSRSFGSSLLQEADCGQALRRCIERAGVLFSIFGIRVSFCCPLAEIVLAK
jgi:hypothetical protein